MERITAQQRDELFDGFQREALHLELRDTYAVANEAERFARFRETGRRDHAAEAADREPWLSQVRDWVAAGKTLRRARVISEPPTEYIRWEWAGAALTVEAGEDIRWLPRRLASGIALPGNDFWLFDGTTVVFTVFSGAGAVVERQRATDEPTVSLCQTAFETVWAHGIPHADYRPA